MDSVNPTLSILVLLSYDIVVNRVMGMVETSSRNKIKGLF